MILINVLGSYRNVVAVCDSDLIGKKYEQGKFQLDVKESFYKGQEYNEEESIRMMKRMAREDATFNILGKDSINAALKAGIIAEEGVGKIQGIPFALVLL